MKIRFILFILTASLVGCATPYQKVGTDMTGGHSFRRLSTDVFSIQFAGNGFTSPKRASDFALLRSAEVCLEHNFRFFSIIGEGDRSSTEIIDTGGTSYTTGTLNSYGGYGTYSGTTTYTPSTMPVFKPGSEITIRCYVSQPGGHAGKIEDAAGIVSVLRGKYKLGNDS